MAIFDQTGQSETITTGWRALQLFTDRYQAIRLFLNICIPIHLMHGFSFSTVMEAMTSPYSCLSFVRTVVNVSAWRNGSM